VFEEIRACAGTQFDPALVETFLALDFGVGDALLSQHSSRAAA
jgi:response regulator RpfG family c-di-GMP phosphodiesterase